MKKLEEGRADIDRQLGFVRSAGEALNKRITLLDTTIRSQGPSAAPTPSAVADNSHGYAALSERVAKVEEEVRGFQAEQMEKDDIVTAESEELKRSLEQNYTWHGLQRAQAIHGFVSPLI